MLGQRDPNSRPWTVERLQTCLDAFDGSGPIVVLANREPVRHDRAADGSVAVRRSASGLVTALEPLVQACSGIWVAHGGIDERFLAVERLLDLHAEFRERFVFVQIAEPSRNSLAADQACRARLVETTDRINLRFGTDRYRPLVLLEAHYEPADVYRFLRAADVCYVGSLHDGMNLVAKKFIAARDDNRGVLVLSRFTGAVRELTNALIVNPYATDDSARTLARALNMTQEEQARRMRAMRAVVAEFNAYRWVGEMLADAARLRADRDLHQTNWQADVLHA